MKATNSHRDRGASYDYTGVDVNNSMVNDDKHV